MDERPVTEDTFRRVVNGATIKQLREAKGITQAELADRIGRTQASVSRIESGQADPDLGDLREVAAALGLTTAELAALFDDAYERARNQADADLGWKRALTVLGIVGLTGLAIFAAALALGALENKGKGGAGKGVAHRGAKTPRASG
jgi:transcriptional regulator with XRE-family HTH domain